MPDVPELTVPQQMACAARILASQGYALDVAGHITVVRPGDDGTMWCTPYGLWWRELTASDIIVIDAAGEVIEASGTSRPRCSSTPRSTGLAPTPRSDPQPSVLRVALVTLHVEPEISDQQACMFDGDVLLFDEYTGGVDDAEGGDYLATAIGGANAIILANHGVLIAGGSVAQATYRASTFERSCQLNYDALASGHKPVPVRPSSGACSSVRSTRSARPVLLGRRSPEPLAAEPEVLN